MRGLELATAVDARELRGGNARPSPVFEARGLAKVYRVGEVEVPALQGVDLDLYPGEMVVILGHQEAASRPWADDVSMVGSTRHAQRPALARQ